MTPLVAADIRARVDDINDAWRSESPADQRRDLADLDEFLDHLDQITADTTDEAERIEALRGRIEIMMDEIEITLGIEPPPLPEPVDVDSEL